VIARRIVVHGRVQGVGFRFSAVDAATAAGVQGWVRNRRDGTVEAVLAGDARAVDDTIAAYHPRLQRLLDGTDDPNGN